MLFRLMRCHDEQSFPARRDVTSCCPLTFISSFLFFFFFGFKTAPSERFCTNRVVVNITCPPFLRPRARVISGAWQVVMALRFPRNSWSCSSQLIELDGRRSEVHMPCMVRVEVEHEQQRVLSCFPLFLLAARALLDSRTSCRNDVYGSSRPRE